MTEEIKPETCCPGREDCTRVQPPRLFRLDNGKGCWAVALVWSENEDGMLNITSYHALAEEDCQALMVAFKQNKPHEEEGP